MAEAATISAAAGTAWLLSSAPKFSRFPALGFAIWTCIALKDELLPSRSKKQQQPDETKRDRITDDRDLHRGSKAM
jgi:hypothetical protein